MTGKEAILKAKHFSLNENWGDPEKIDPKLIEEVDRYRDFLGFKLHISPARGAVYAEGKGHAEKSWHYIVPGRNNLAMAMDVFPEGDLAYAWLAAMRFQFGGIGVYPMAVYNEKGLVGMLHLDIRPIAPHRTFWWRDGAGQYFWLRNSMDVERLLSYLIV